MNVIVSLLSKPSLSCPLKSFLQPEKEKNFSKLIKLKFNFPLSIESFSQLLGSTNETNNSSLITVISLIPYRLLS